MNIEIRPRQLLRVLFAVIAVLFLGHATGLVFKHVFGRPSVYGLVPMFNFDTEANVPTLFTSFILLTAGLLLALIACGHKRLSGDYLRWAVLAVVFVFLAVDEINQVHERLTGPFRDLLNVDGFLHFTWVIPYSGGLLILCAAYIPFLRRLPAPTRYLFLVSGFIYLSGAIGFELLGGQAVTNTGNMETISYVTYSTCEELLEMIGISLFIYALLGYMTTRFIRPSIVILSDH